MCIKVFATFDECGHYEAQIMNCPTWHKENRSVKTFFSSMFGREDQTGKKPLHCGKTIPRFQHGTICMECGPQRYQEERTRKQRKYTAQESLRKTEDLVRRGKQHKTRLEPMRGLIEEIPYHYTHPELREKKTAYRRTTKELPPIPSRSHKSSTTHKTSTAPRSSLTHKSSSTHKVPSSSAQKSSHHSDKRGVSSSSRRTEPRSSSTRDRTTTMSRTQPPKRPIEAAPTRVYGGKFANNGPGLPPARGPPPPPQKTTSQRYERDEPSRYAHDAFSTRRVQEVQAPMVQQVHAYVREPHILRPAPRPTHYDPPKTLRRINARIEYSVLPRRPVEEDRRRPFFPASAKEVPKGEPWPEYLQYLTEMHEAAKNAPTHAEKVAQIALTRPFKTRPPKKREEHRPSRWHNLGKAIGFDLNDDSSSEASFVCETSAKMKRDLESKYRYTRR